MNYVLRVADNRRVYTTVHVSHMKPYVDPASRPILCPPEDVEDSFLLEPTWEPLENILDPSLITKYYQDHPRAKNLVHHASSYAEQTSPEISVIANFSFATGQFQLLQLILKLNQSHLQLSRSSIYFAIIAHFQVFISTALLCCFLWIFTPAQFILLNLTRPAS